MIDLEKLKAKLEVLAAKPTRSDKDDFVAYEYSGGNFDDAWQYGMDDGERFLAAELLREFFTPSKEE